MNEALTQADIIDMTDKELRQEISDVTAEYQDCERQLGNKNKEVDGVRLTEKQYFEWRNKANHAKTKIAEDLRALKLELRNRNESKDETHLAVLKEILNELKDIKKSIQASNGNC